MPSVITGTPYIQTARRGDQVIIDPSAVSFVSPDYRGKGPMTVFTKYYGPQPSEEEDKPITKAVDPWPDPKWMTTPKWETW